MGAMALSDPDLIQRLEAAANIVMVGLLYDTWNVNDLWLDVMLYGWNVSDS